MSVTLADRIAASLSAPVNPAVSDFAAQLAQGCEARAILFYGSNLRTGALDGVLDFYVLTSGRQIERIWPRVSYHEWQRDGMTLRAKVATMALETFAEAASGALIDTTIWARFVQPSALVWQRDADSAQAVREAIGIGQEGLFGQRP